MIPRERPKLEEAFKILGLRANPFHADPDPTNPPRTFADFREIWGVLRDKYETVFQRGYNQRLIVFGPYGSGKSHILRYLHDQIGALYSHQDNRGVSFYGRIPLTMRFRDLYSSFIESVSLERLNFLYQLPGENVSLSSVGNEVKNASRHLAKTGKERQIAWNWLCAKPTYVQERWDIGVTTRLDRDDYACLDAFISLLKLLLARDVKTIFIGVDELEKMRTWTAGERRLTQNMLEYFRMLIDSFPGRIFFALASTTEWARVFTSYGAFSSRFAADERCYLKNFQGKNFAEFKLFILEYLDLERLGIDELQNIVKNAGMTEEMATITDSELKEAGVTEREDLNYLTNLKTESGQIPLYPFSKQALERVVELSEGTPRGVIQMCHLLIERAVEEIVSMTPKPSAHMITSEKVKQIESRLRP